MVWRKDIWTLAWGCCSAIFLPSWGWEVRDCEILSSHITARTLRLCEENNIAFFFLPPNSTHMLRTLDVTFLQSLSAWQLWPRQIHLLLHTNITPIQNNWHLSTLVTYATHRNYSQRKFNSSVCILVFMYGNLWGLYEDATTAIVMFITFCCWR